MSRTCSKSALFNIKWFLLILFISVFRSLFLQQIINHIMERSGMHRRNHAASSLEKNNFHQNINLGMERLSLGHEYNGPLTMRLSDIGSMRNQIFIPSASFSIRQQHPLPKDEKTKRKVSNLKNNLMQLQQKLTKALWQLQSCQKKAPIPPLSPPPISHHITPEYSINGLFICSQVSQEESTMNLSTQKMMMSIKSKQKLLNSHKRKEYYVGSLIRGISGNCPLALEHLQSALNTSKLGASLQFPSVLEIQHQKLHLPKAAKYQKKKTVVIEFNQTLLHLRSEKLNPDDIKIGSESNSTVAYISVRPYALSFLKKISQVFEIIVFSNLSAQIVSLILDEIDQQKQLISHSIDRSRCTHLKNGIVAKDLRVLNRSLMDTVIIDSNPESYIMQPNNAIPLLPYQGGNDSQLMDLQRYLIRQLLRGGDVRQINKEKFKLGNYWQYQDEIDVVKNLYLHDEYN